MRQPQRIYIVEDDTLTASVLATTLRKNTGAEVFTFDEAPPAITACRKLWPDVLILDYQLPGISGIELFDLLKKDIPDNKIVIMASAIDDGSMVLKFIQKGIRNYVIKDETFIDSILEIIKEGSN